MSDEETKHKIKTTSQMLILKRKQANCLRSELKEVMTRKARLERNIQPIMCELQRLEDQHADFLETVTHLNGMNTPEIIPNELMSNNQDLTQFHQC
jgi:predicted  nucleic acid-binding Zn-ribbon protein